VYKVLKTLNEFKDSSTNLRCSVASGVILSDMYPLLAKTGTRR